MKSYKTWIQLIFFALFVLFTIKGRINLWIGVFAAGLILSLIFGRGYCAYVCPMNTVMRPASWISSKLKLQRDRIPRWLSFKGTPWIFFGLMVGSMLFTKRILQISFPALLIFLILSFIVTLFYKPEVFHNRLCPFGALLGLAGKGAVFTETVDADQCVGCKMCVPVCPAGAVQVSPLNRKAVIQAEFCHQCQACETACPKDAIHYRRKIKTIHS